MLEVVVVVDVEEEEATEEEKAKEVKVKDEMLDTTMLKESKTVPRIRAPTKVKI